MEKLGNRFDIPIGMADIDMTEISGQLRQLPLYVQSRPIPFDELSCCEGMPHILQSRPAPNTLAPCLFPQPDSAGHLRECATGNVIAKRSTVLGDEEPAGWMTAAKLIAPLNIVRKGCTGRVLDGDEAGLPELCVPDREDTVLQIYIRHDPK